MNQVQDDALKSVLLDMEWKITGIDRHSGAQENLQQLECRPVTALEEKYSNVYYWAQDVVVRCPQDQYTVGDHLRLVVGLNEQYQQQYRHQSGQTPYTNSTSFVAGLENIHLGIIQQIVKGDENNTSVLQVTISACGLPIILRVPFVLHPTIIDSIRPEISVYIGITRLKAF
jgi:hypothetical protein